MKKFWSIIQKCFVFFVLGSMTVFMAWFVFGSLWYMPKPVEFIAPVIDNNYVLKTEKEVYQEEDIVGIVMSFHRNYSGRGKRGTDFICKTEDGITRPFSNGLIAIKARPRGRWENVVVSRNLPKHARGECYIHLTWEYKVMGLFPREVEAITNKFQVRGLNERS